MNDRPVSPRGVVVVGDALIDEIHRDGKVEDFVGGAALNVAVGLSALGIRTSLIAMVGNDEDGATIRAFLAHHSVALIPTIGPNGSSRGVSDRKDGEPFYVFNAAAQARRIEFGPAEREALAAASLVVVSCFPFGDVDQSLALLDAVPDARARLIIDPNPRSSMMHDVIRFRETFEKLVPKTLLVKVGDDDSELLYGSSVEALSDRLLVGGAAAVLATAGPRGASIRTATGVEARVPIAQLPGDVIDTMGAGDATLASVISSILTGRLPANADDWTAVLERAMLIAAATCRSEGALLRVPD
jgi:sugar/nucleoside kinase (ribokinase family)